MFMCLSLLDNITTFQECMSVSAEQKMQVKLTMIDVKARGQLILTKPIFRPPFLSDPSSPLHSPAREIIFKNQSS